MKLPTIIIKGNSISIQRDIEDNYTSWLIISESVLNRYDKITRHNICNCVRNQIQLMVSWLNSFSALPVILRALCLCKLFDCSCVESVIFSI